MDITIQPGILRGSVTVIPSKSQAHRLLICAAFADNAGNNAFFTKSTNACVSVVKRCIDNGCRERVGFSTVTAV